MTNIPTTSDHSYPVRVGLAVDELLNVVFFDGEPYETISFHAAVAAQSKKRWGCILCKVLDVVVEKNHCANQLTSGPSTPLTAFRAFLAIGAALWALHGVFDLLVRGVRAIFGL